MINSLLISGTLFLEWTEAENISGYKICITSGTQPQSVLDLGRSASYVYSNPSGYSTIGFSYTGYDYNGAAIVNESRSYTLTNYVLSSATCYSFRSRSFISAKTNGTISSLMFSTSTGSVYGPLQYTGGTLLTSSWLPKAMKCYAVDTGGRVSNTVSVIYSSCVYEQTVDYFYVPDYSDVASFKSYMVSTGAGAFYFTTGTVTSGAWLVVDSSNLFKNFFDTVYINRSKDFVGKPLLMFVTDTSNKYIGTSFGNVFVYKKLLGTGSSYMAIMPKFERV